jgi:pimeloyl-ACP methyl ester carboxylesterase
MTRDATPLVSLHGQGGSLENFRHNVRALSRNHHVVALDLLWYGRSGTLSARALILTTPVGLDATAQPPSHRAVRRTG